MYGYKKVYHVWFKRHGEWYPVGVGKLHPIDIKEEDNARDIAYEAYTRPFCQAAVVYKVEDVPVSNLETHQVSTYRHYEQVSRVAVFEKAGTINEADSPGLMLV